MGDKFRINKIKPTVRKTLGDNKKIATQRAKLSDVKPDTFEHAKNADDMGTMKFKTQKIKFYPEDIEKMKSMSVEEKINYAIKLREQGKYTVIK